MKKSFTLTVPEPCHEYWNDMTPNEQGRHCAICTKTVVDFTRKTDREIAKLVKSGGSLCGRFKKEQLGRPITLPRKRDTFFELVPPSYAASLLIPVALFGTQHIKAQETYATLVEQVSTYRDTQPHIQGSLAIKPSTTRTFELRGIVSDEYKTLQGASIFIKGTRRSTQTDSNGDYSIQVANGETLTISFVGYINQEILVDIAQNKLLDIILQSDNELMGDIIVLGRIAPPQLINENPKPKGSKPSKHN